MISALLAVALAQASVAPASFKWSDARADYDAWLDVQAIAEVEPSVEGAAAVKALSPLATRETPSPRVALWQLPGNDAARVLAVLEQKLPGHFAPVFHDDATTAAKLRVPAGGVMVWLAPAEVARFVVRHGLIVTRDFGNGTLLVASAAGAASLSLSASLRTDPAVKTVMPNWWLKPHKR
jgi:hypothetical protein